jgi:uncharacterized phage infection (PIP) family protein YhgE
MSPSCPISTRRVDTNMMRIISFQVVLFTLALLFTQEKLFALILLFDFAVRALRITGLSPFHTIGKIMLNGWGTEPKLCDESPKRFALYLGLITSFFLSLFYIGGAVEIAAFITTILLTCALLEALFDFCIGCKIYYAIQLLKAFKNDRNFH